MTAAFESATPALINFSISTVISCRRKKQNNFHWATERYTGKAFTALQIETRHLVPAGEQLDDTANMIFASIQEKLRAMMM